MRSGRLRHRVILERPTETQAEGGQVVNAFEPVTMTCPAEIEAIAGREFFAAAQVQADVTTRIRIRFRPDIDETWRVKHIRKHDSPAEADLYDIVAVIADSKTNRRELQLMCTLRRAEGWRQGETSESSPQEEFRVDNPDLHVDDPSWRVDSQ